MKQLKKIEHMEIEREMESNESYERTEYLHPLPLPGEEHGTEEPKEEDE